MPHSTQTTTPRRLVPASPARRLLLRVIDSPDAALAGAHFDLTAPDASWLFGRAGPSAIADPRLSRQHCRVTHVAGAVRVEDLGSRNGCFLSGQPVQREYLLPNRVLRAGDTLFLLDEEPDPDQMVPPDLLDPSVAEIVGQSFVTESLRRWVAAAGRTAAHVLLRGPTGTGKEVAARALHRLSGRTGPFVAVNCGAIAPELADAELFGHRKGSFTGADRSRAGLFAEAERGTLFLDEVGELPPALQVKLLRVLEERRMRRVGETLDREIDVRVIGATNADLESNGFRSDLLARLSQWVIELTPLAERRADVLPLARCFVRRHAADTSEPRWTPELAEALVLHDWPHNARELDNLVRRLAVVGAGRTWDLPLLPAAMRSRLVGRQTEREAPTTDTPGRAELEAALAGAAGNVARVAQRYGRDRAQVYRWLKRHGIDPERFR